MALLLNSPHTKRPHLLLLHSQPHQHPTLRNLTIKLQDSSSSANGTEDTASSTVAKKAASSSSLGFGSSVSTTSKKKQQKGKRSRDTIIRREPIQKPVFATQSAEESGSKEFQKNESAFLLAWLGLGGIILVQGILLAASGFLPEAWDNFLVNYLYPSFTPTVFLFVAGTVGYGVLKYLQNEKFNSEN